MLHIHTIPAFEDNYFWLIQPDTQSPDSYIVDPGSAQIVHDYLNQHQLYLVGILLTHHHHDHIDGAAELHDYYQCPIYGPRSPRIPHVTHCVSEGDCLALGSLTAKVLTLPGHTLDHIAYLIETPLLAQTAIDPSHLFSGDTLFGAGCGRIFDGTAQLLFAALQRIAEFSNDTLVYGGHEYTLANIRFALTIEPDNAELKLRLTTETEKRRQGIATLPTQLGVEKRTNPFLRCGVDSVRRSVEQISGKTLTSDTDVFTSLRLIKDCF
jgi:hydroxyacylglutathione hydrolase